MFIITEHAVDRFRVRVDNTLSRDATRVLLERLAPTAMPIEKRTHAGGELRRVDKPLCLLVCKKERRDIYVVTVLGKAEMYDEYDEEVIAAFQRSMRVVTNEIASEIPKPLRTADVREMIEQIADRKLFEQIDLRLDRFLKKRGA